ncbi:Peptidyl-tRNA hydrolase family protein [Spironucleus salmonicida]|uniref:peptidyl-tRNA hydrolase n=1 Tax=Spironucleus salmonicida TaxID=348837 RepID=V6LVZ0_9EUKA|nr:Peptidyl-tRNA hydrolase family protein [Spironucleus salmonicida]|eukprot:EST48797.1 Peptidyl-tRNA hydrolase family protein [Spironucleus salmonicida]
MALVQYIIVRTDLKFSKGALAVNIAHASVAAIYKSINSEDTQNYLKDTENMTKIALKVGSEEELRAVFVNIQDRSYMWVEQPENVPVAIATFPTNRTSFPQLKGLKLFS